ncbi:MAG: hypothetical protein AAF542_17200 [Pseudomonadota bacterium]
MVQIRIAVSTTPIVSVLAFIAMFAGFQGGRYLYANRLQELGIFCALLLFVWGAWLSLFRLQKSEWRNWTYKPSVLLLGIMLLGSITFALNFSDNVLFSFFASREYLLGFLGPGLFLLCRSGYPIEHFERVFWCVLLALLINYLYFYATLDLRATFFSPDHTVSNLVTYDEWRGFRLKPPTFAIMVALMASLLLILRFGFTIQLLMALLMFGLSVYIWSIVQFRSTLATMLLAMFLYPLLLRRPERLQYFWLLSPLIILATPIVFHMVLEQFAGADGGGLRLRSFQTALGGFMERPMLGAGEDNSYGKTYQMLYGKTFYPSDLGMVGTLFKYGAFGLGLYLYVHVHIVRSLLIANARYADVYGRHNALLWAVLMFSVAQTFNLILNPGLSYAPGITMGSVGLALAGLWRVHLSFAK